MLDEQSRQRLEAAEATRHKIVRAGLDVHRALGPGFREEAYEKCLAYELRRRGHVVQEQVWFDVRYDDLVLPRMGRADLVVDELVIVEIKAAVVNHPTFGAQVISYLKASGLPVGILLNFGVQYLLKEGYDKFVRPDLFAKLELERLSKRSASSVSSASSERGGADAERSLPPTRLR